MVVFVVDKSLLKLRDQINILAPGRSKRSDGTIGDADHAAGNSDHNPQDTSDSSDNNDPDNQVDAIDITHDPAHGCDVGKIWESIRVSRDRRVSYAIFNRRIFSSYSNSSRKAWEWGPYNGEDPHDTHGHLSVNDEYNDDTREWDIYMATVTDKHLTAIMWTDERVEALLLMLTKTRSGNVNELGAFLRSMNSQINANAAALRQVSDRLDAAHVKLDALLARPSGPDIDVDYETLANLIVSKLHWNGEEISAEVIEELKAWITRP